MDDDEAAERQQVARGLAASAEGGPLERPVRRESVVFAAHLGTGDGGREGMSIRAPPGPPAPPCLAARSLLLLPFSLAPGADPFPPGEAARRLLSRRVGGADLWERAGPPKEAQEL